MPQFFVDKSFEAGDEVEIAGADARHISQSLRLAAGDWIVLSDGRGRSFRAGIAESSPRRVRARIIEELKRRAGPAAPVLALAVVKGDRFEWAIQKSVELGCRRVIPFISDRCVEQRIDARKLARWRTIALEAAKQSGLPFRPDVDEAVSFKALCGMIGGFGRAVLFYEGERSSGIRSLLKGDMGKSPSLLIVGPEGGFTDEEVGAAKDAGATSASLGTQILRVETAAVAAMSIWQYELGNMDAG